MVNEPQSRPPQNKSEDILSVIPSTMIVPSIIIKLGTGPAAKQREFLKSDLRLLFNRYIMQDNVYDDINC